MLQGRYTKTLTAWRACLTRAAGSLIVGLVAVGLTGCGTTHLTASAGYATITSMEDAEARLVEQQLRDAEQQWHGTPYRWGGVTRDGVDCSGFVMNVYQDTFGLPLPRTTAAQARAGQAVRLDALQAGDLIFFRTSRKTRHVGIYLGDGEFAHASTSHGVMTSRLDETYWRETYWTSRRLLPTYSAATPPFPLPPPTTHPSPDRTGW